MQTGGDVIGVVGAIVTLLLVAAATHGLARRIGMPFTVALVVMGVGLAQLGQSGIPFLEVVADLTITPEVAFFVFLPTLVFEAAFNMDGRALRENAAPVLTLAVPGLVISAGVAGVVLWIGARTVGLELSWAEALLLGSILSATDTIGVSSIFRHLGAPKRLLVLVDGESLFNDATAIVLSRILLALVVAGGVASDPVLEAPGGAVSWQTVAAALLQFVVVFVGGIGVGWLAALLFGFLLGKVEGDAFVEISLTTILAYLTFLLAEELLGVSGVMAVVAAGLVIGGWGKAKISPSVAGYLDSFWGYMASVANALIFLMVGLTVDLGALARSVDMLGWVVAGMLLSRFGVIYLLIPLIGRLPGQDPLDRRYQHVIFWGGLRGGIALAIALSLPPFPNRDLFVALVTGAVLFALLVQGLTMEKVVRHFRLHVPSLADQVARIEGLISAKRRTLDQVPELQAGGLFSPRIAEAITQRCSGELVRMRQELEDLRERELDMDEERRLIHLRCFGAEKTLYYQMFSRGHLSERAYRNLTHSIELQTEAIRHEGRIPEFTLHPPDGERFENVLFRIVDQMIGLGSLAERLRSSRTARDYEVTWARSRGSRQVLEDLDELTRQESVRTDIAEEVRASYRFWHESARARLEQTAEQFPEFVASTQERLADRLVLHAEHEAIEEKAHAGIIPEGVAEVMLQEMTRELRDLRASQVGTLRVQPDELLRKVPFFQGIPPDEFLQVASRLRRRTAPAGDVIVRQGTMGDSLFLVARGVIRVFRTDAGTRRDLSTLMAGDFFGEIALLHGGPRTATCRAVTPCALYELRREDLEAVLEACPSMQEALEEAGRRRKAAHGEVVPARTAGTAE